MAVASFVQFWFQVLRWSRGNQTSIIDRLLGGISGTEVLSGDGNAAVAGCNWGQLEEEINVRFIGKEGIDDGGLTREFITMLFKYTPIFKLQSYDAGFSWIPQQGSIPCKAFSCRWHKYPVVRVMGLLLANCMWNCGFPLKNFFKTSFIRFKFDLQCIFITIW